MAIEENWETIKKLELHPKQKIQRSFEWISVDIPFPEYRVFIGSKHLEQHVDSDIDEIANRSGKKAKRFTLINHYSMPFDVEIQKKISDHKRSFISQQRC